jgi:hypothetical protein
VSGGLFIPSLWSQVIAERFKSVMNAEPDIPARETRPEHELLYQALSLEWGDPFGWKVRGELAQLITWLHDYDVGINPFDTVGEYFTWWARQVGPTGPSSARR